jgi:hypothetical protein
MQSGDLVLCVCDFTKFVNKFDESLNYPKPGKYYTIRKSNRLATGEQIVFLDEIENKEIITIDGHLQEIGFQGNCFMKMPIPSISELTDLLK